MTVDEYKDEILRCEGYLKKYSGFKKFFRFPMLGEGDTAEKRDLLRIWLSQNGYKNGYVTIDSSDWYVNLKKSFATRVKRATTKKIKWTNSAFKTEMKGIANLGITAIFFMKRTGQLVSDWVSVG